MDSHRSFRDAYFEIYENLNEAAPANPTNTKVTETPVKKATEAPKTTPAPETPKASPEPEAPKSPFASKSELENLRSSAARATVAGPSKEAQALMSPRTKTILSGKSVYSRGSGRDDMISGNLQRAKSDKVSTSTPPSSSDSSDKSNTSTSQPSSGSGTAGTPPQSSSNQQPSTSSATRATKNSFRIGAIAIGNRGNTRTDKTVNKTVNKTIIKSPEDRLPKTPKTDKRRPDSKTPDNRKPEENDKIDSNNPLIRAVYDKRKNRLIPRSLSSSYEYDAKLVEDIVNYLLDEGYAETPEAAEKIMENMSEKWISNIIG
jgi:hypothetical protein